MISEVVMPQMGADMIEGTVLRWLKGEGDEVKRGEVIAEIETDKANVEIEAFDSGVFRKALASEGDTVQVGEVIAVIAGAGEDISKYASGERAAATAPEASAGATARGGASSTASAPSAATDPPQAESTPASDRPPEPAPPSDVRRPQPPTANVERERASSGAPHREQQPPATNGRVRASPVARRIAQERGIDLRSVRGSGPDGRIIRRDVESAAVTGGQPATSLGAQPVSPAASAGAQPAASPAGPITMSRMRQAIARRMSQAKREQPHYYLLVDIDMTDAMAFRKQANESLPEDQHLTVNDLIVKACAIGLQRHPSFNVTASGDEFRQHEQQNVCVAIALDDGLIAPAIIDAGSKPLSQIARETKDLAARAKGGSLRQDEITAGTFSITNLGAFGIETLIGIIQPPQTAILGAGSVMPQPAVRDGAVVVRQLMKVALSADHRLTDGAQGARFLAEIKRLLEQPMLLVL